MLSLPPRQGRALLKLIQPTPVLTALSLEMMSLVRRQSPWSHAHQAEAPSSLLCLGAAPQPGEGGCPGSSASRPAPKKEAQPRPQHRAAPRLGASDPWPRSTTRSRLPTARALSPCWWPSSHAAPGRRKKHCKTNPHYPHCSTLRIEAQFAARAAHLPAPAAPYSAPRHS